MKMKFNWGKRKSKTERKAGQEFFSVHIRPAIFALVILSLASAANAGLQQRNNTIEVLA